MEINKMLTVSTAHITQETAELLDKICKDSTLSSLIVYEKVCRYKNIQEEYGWFIYCNVNLADLKAPEDLLNVICFAKDLGCAWLCFDRDGDILDYLETYNW